MDDAGDPERPAGRSVDDCGASDGGTALILAQVAGAAVQNPALAEDRRAEVEWVLDGLVGCWH